MERLKASYHLSWFEETGALFQIQFTILKDEVTVMLDTSGAGLHKRGISGTVGRRSYQGDTGGGHGRRGPGAVGAGGVRSLLRVGNPAH